MKRFSSLPAASAKLRLKIKNLKEKKDRLLLSLEAYSEFKVLPDYSAQFKYIDFFFPPPTQQLAHAYWPADVVGSAAPHLRQTTGFFWHLIWAARHDGLAPSLRACHIAAGTEEQLMRVFRGHAVKKSAQGLVAAGTIAQARFARRLDTRWHIFSAQPLAQVIHIAGFGRVQTPVCRRKAQIRVCKGLEREQSAVINVVWWSEVRLNYS